MLIDAAFPPAASADAASADSASFPAGRLCRGTAATSATSVWWARHGRLHLAQKQWAKRRIASCHTRACIMLVVGLVALEDGRANRKRLVRMKMGHLVALVCQLELPSKSRFGEIEKRIAFIRPDVLVSGYVQKIEFATEALVAKLL